MTGKTSAMSVRIWDLPTRLFHGLLALTLVGSVVTAQLGGAWMTWHLRLGLLAGALLLFRLVWGFVGGRWSRFASFVYGPAALWRHLRGRSRPEDLHEVGHSPLGALSVFAMLLAVAGQVGTGLVSDDEIAMVGPLNHLVTSATGLAATAWHKGWGKSLLLALVVLHVAAVLFYRVVKGRDLIRPMLDGDRELPPGTPASRDDLRTRALALGVVAVCAAIAVWVARSAG